MNKTWSLYDGMSTTPNESERLTIHSATRVPLTDLTPSEGHQTPETTETVVPFMGNSGEHESQAV